MKVCRIRNYVISYSFLLIFILSILLGTGNNPDSNTSINIMEDTQTGMLDDVTEDNNPSSEVTTVLHPLETNPSASIDSISYIINETKPEPTVEVREFTDHSMSFFGQSKDDTLRFAFKFYTHDSARFAGWAYLYKTETQIASAHWEGNVASDTEAVTLFDFCGYNIEESISDGPYNISLDFQKHNETGTFDIYNRAGDNNNLNYTSQAYLRTDFAPNPITVNEFSDEGVSNDGNPFYEWLKVDINITATVGGEYNFDGSLHKNDGSHEHMDNARAQASLDIGENIVSLYFAGWKLGRITSTMAFNFSVNIHHRAYPHYTVFEKNDIYLPHLYAPSDFDTIPVEITVVEDQAYDSNNDGYFDYYRVTATLNSTRKDPNIQLVLLSELHAFNATVSETVVYDHWNSQNFQMGSLFLINVTYEFAGGLINSKNLTDMTLVTKFRGKLFHTDNNDWDHHTDDDWWNVDESPIFNSNTNYNYTDFSGIPVQLTDNYYDYGVDTDEDGLYNYLNVDVEIEVLQSGTYNLNAQIRRDWDGYHFQGSGTTNYFSQGFHNVTLQFDGYYFYQYSNETINLADVWLGDTNNNQFDWADQPKTLDWAGMLFDPIPVQLTGIFSEESYSDESVIFYVEIEANEEGIYIVQGRLRNPITNEEYWQQTERVSCPIGTHSVALEFPGEWFFSQQTNTSYILERFEIHDENWYQWGQFEPNYVTALIYNSSEFVHPDAMILSIIDTPIDAGTNGKFDYIRFDTEVEVFTSGKYFIQVELENIYSDRRWDNEFWSGMDWQPTYLDPGIHTISSYFGTAWLYRQEVVQKFTICNINLRKQVDWGGDQEIDRRGNMGMTQEYDPNDFEPPGLYFIDHATSYGLDIDPDGLFDYLVFEIQVEIFIEGHYQINGRLLEMNQEHFPWGTLFEGDLSPGPQNLQLKTDSKQFYNTFKNQSYICEHFRIYYDINDDPDHDDWRQIDIISWSAYSDVYNYTEFQPPLISLTHNYDDYGWDSTPERPGFSGLAVDVEVQVTKTGNYSTHLYFFNNETDEGHWLTSNTSTLNPGFYNITVVCDDSTYILSQPENSSFQIRHIQLNIEGYDYTYDYYDETDYTLNDYPRSAFDIPDIVLTGYYAERVIDNDGDFLIDYIEIDVGINVTVNSVEVWMEVALGNETGTDLMWAHYESHWFDPSYLTEGLHVITFQFDARVIYDLKITYRLFLTRVRVERTDGWWRETDRNYPLAALTQDYIWNECEKPPASVVGVVGESLIDTDNNGLYDYLGITINVSVGIPSEYQVQGYLRYSDNNGFRNEWSATNAQFHYGYNTITLYWPCINLDRDGYSSMWAFDLHEIRISKEKEEGYSSNSWGHLWHEHNFLYWYRTNLLDLSQFERQPIESIQAISTIPVDYDLDGEFDFIRAKIEINSTVSGDFRLDTTLADLTDGWHDHFSWTNNYVNLAVGQNNFYIYHSGQRLYEHGRIDGTYAIGHFNINKIPTDLGSLYVSDWAMHIYGSDEWYALPSQYDYTDFSSSWYEDPITPDYQTVLINGNSPSDHHLEVPAYNDLVIQVTVTNPDNVRAVYIDINGRWFLTNKTGPADYEWSRYMGIPNLDTYNVEIVIVDYLDYHYRDWYNIDVVYSPTFEITSVDTDLNSYRVFTNMTMNITVENLGTSVQSIIVQYYDTWLDATKYSDNGTHEFWTITIHLTYTGLHEVIIAVQGIDNYETHTIKLIEVQLDARPTIHYWEMDKTRIWLNDNVSFAAYVSDDLDIMFVRVHIGDRVFDLSLLNVLYSGHEIWNATIDIDDADLVGLNTVQIEAIDNLEQSTLSSEGKLSVREVHTLSIADVTLTPSRSRYLIDTTLQISVTVWRTEALITSVTAFGTIEGYNLEYSSALEMVSDDSENRESVYEGTMTLEVTGDWEIEIRVMNTKNEIVTYPIPFEVYDTDSEPPTLTSGIPGFELGLLFAMAIFFVVYYKKRKK